MTKLIGNFESIFRGIAALTFHHLFMAWLLLDIFTRKIYYRLFPFILRGRKMDPWKRVVQWHSGVLLDIIGVKVIKEYEEKEDLSQYAPYLLMFTHGSNLDSFTMIANVKDEYLNFVGKKELFKIPVIAYIFKESGLISIDRDNLQSAKESLNVARDKIHKEKTSIAISPEGTRRRSDSDAEPRILPFKKGPFHVAKQTGVNIVPVVIHGAHRLWPPKQIFPVAGTVVLKVCKPIPKKLVEESEIEVVQTKLREIYDRNVRKVDNAVVFSNPEKKYFAFILFLIVGLSFTALFTRFVCSFF